MEIGNFGTLKFIKQALINTKYNHHNIIEYNLNIPLSQICSPDKKIDKAALELSSIIDQTDLTDIYRKFYSTM